MYILLIWNHKDFTTMKLVFVPLIENANSKMLAEAAVCILGVHVAVNAQNSGSAFSV